MGQSGGALRGAKDDSGKDDDVKKQVDSDDNCQKPIYQLVNVKDGGGKLIDILKSSARISSGSFALNKSMDLCTAQKELDTMVDKQIHDLVEPLLYNGGRGKWVPLSTIWAYRLRKQQTIEEEENKSKEEADGTNLEADNIPKDGDKYRLVCWKLEELGFVGETALHICFLLSTPTHMLLAKKLLSMFPMLINDIYTCDQYFGESSLANYYLQHMGIVNENVRIVKLLLDYGANVHERCLGSFFLPTDQKDTANGPIRRIFDKIKNSNQQPQQEHKNKPPIDSSDLEFEHIDLKSNHLNTLDTNYDGYAYWGEYPLSFAVCLGLSDCYKLLLAKGANPNRQDSNGNATLHMAVIADRIDMFDLCYSNGANLSILNKQNLSPLTLAAKLRRVNMFFHILTIQRQVSWIFCNVGFVEVPLKGIDSIDITDGSCDDDSVLSIVAFGGSNEHLQMLDGLLSRLLEIKWETSARQKFFWWFCKFLIFLFISSIAYITRFDNIRKQTLQNNESTLMSKYLNLKVINEYSEYALVCFVFYYLWIIIQRVVASFNIRDVTRSLAQAPEMFMFTLTCLLIVACIPLRLVRWKQAEDFVAAIIMFTLPLKLLFFCRASRSVGSFVVMIYKIVVNDVLCFVVFLVIFVAGFSQSFLIMFKTHKRGKIFEMANSSRSQTESNSSSIISLTLDTENEAKLPASFSGGVNDDKNYFINLFDGIISMHMMAYNEFGIVFDEFNSTDYPKLAKILFCVYMILVSILLINMLIAMLGKTYQDIASQPNENLRQWARALLFVERMWSKKDKLKMLDMYSHLVPPSASSQSLNDDRSYYRYYCSTWALTEKDRIEINLMKKLNQENKMNASRLQRMEARLK